jgi:hypothetical protein
VTTNSQVFPQSTWPLAGDLTSAPGNPNITVDGIQNIPVSPTLPLDQQSIVYQGTLAEYTPAFSPFNRSLQVNGVGVSDDYGVFVKEVDLAFQVNSTYPPNGKPILVNGA